MTLQQLKSKVKSQIMQELNCNEFTMNKLWQWAIERSVELTEEMRDNYG